MGHFNEFAILTERGHIFHTLKWESGDRGLAKVLPCLERGSKRIQTCNFPNL